MKIFKIVLIIVLSLGLVGGVGYLYASSGVKSNPGYIKLSPPAGGPVDTVIALNLGPRGVKPVRWLLEKISEKSDQELEVPERVFMSVLQELQGVQLRVYDVHNNHDVFAQAIADSVSSLREKNWQPLLSVREDDQYVVVMHPDSSDQIAGLSIMASTADNAIFINLIGPFDLESIARTVHYSQ